MPIYSGMRNLNEGDFRFNDKGEKELNWNNESNIALIKKDVLDFAVESKIPMGDKKEHDQELVFRYSVRCDKKAFADLEWGIDSVDLTKYKLAIIRTFKQDLFFACIAEVCNEGNSRTAHCNIVPEITIEKAIAKIDFGDCVVVLEQEEVYGRLLQDKSMVFGTLDVVKKIACEYYERAYDMNGRLRDVFEEVRDKNYIFFEKSKEDFELRLHSEHCYVVNKSLNEKNRLNIEYLRTRNDVDLANLLLRSMILCSKDGASLRVLSQIQEYVMRNISDCCLLIMKSVWENKNTLDFVYDNKNLSISLDVLRKTIASFYAGSPDLSELCECLKEKMKMEDNGIPWERELELICEEVKRLENIDITIHCGNENLLVSHSVNSRLFGFEVDDFVWRLEEIKKTPESVTKHAEHFLRLVKKCIVVSSVVSFCTKRNIYYCDSEPNVNNNFKKEKVSPIKIGDSTYGEFVLTFRDQEKNYWDLFDYIERLEEKILSIESEAFYQSISSKICALVWNKTDEQVSLGFTVKNKAVYFFYTQDKSKKTIFQVDTISILELLEQKRRSEINFKYISDFVRDKVEKIESLIIPRPEKSSKDKVVYDIVQKELASVDLEVFIYGTEEYHADCNAGVVTITKNASKNNSVFSSKVSFIPSADRRENEEIRETIKRVMRNTFFELSNEYCKVKQFLRFLRYYGVQTNLRDGFIEIMKEISFWLPKLPCYKKTVDVEKLFNIKLRNSCEESIAIDIYEELNDWSTPKFANGFGVL